MLLSCYIHWQKKCQKFNLQSDCRSVWRTRGSWSCPHPQWCMKPHNHHQQPDRPQRSWCINKCLRALTVQVNKTQSESTTHMKTDCFAVWRRFAPLTGPNPPPSDTKSGWFFRSKSSICWTGVWLVERRQGSDKTWVVSRKKQSLLRHNKRKQLVCLTLVPIIKNGGWLKDKTKKTDRTLKKKIIISATVHNDKRTSSPKSWSAKCTTAFQNTYQTSF